MTSFPKIVPAGRWLRLVLALVALLGGQSSHAAHLQPSASEPQQILLLYAYGYGGRGVELFSEGFFKAITEAGFPVANVYAEYLDLQRNKDVPGYRQELRDMLHRKYAQRHIDLVVTVQQPALEFLLTDGQEIAPQAPVITILHRPLLEAEMTGRRIVGEVNQFDIKGTLERALELFPQTQRVVFASGSSAADIQLAEEAARVAGTWQGRLEFEYTTGLALDAILQRVAHLPPHTVIIFTQYNVDPEGRVALAYEVERMIVKAANAPVFGFYDYNLHNGGIGGSVIAVEASGARTGRLALDILTGAAPATAGTLLTNENIPMFDWAQIQRWGGDINRLPATTMFVNRPPSAWQQYGAVSVGAMIFLLAQSALITVLLANIRRRKRAESVLGESEAKFHAIFDGILDSVVFADTQRCIQMVNPAFTHMFGYNVDEAIGRSTALLYADPADYAEQGRRRFHSEATGDSGVYELRYRRKDGTEFWAETSGTRIAGPNGKVHGLIGMHRDITERKQAEEEVRRLNADLEHRVEQRTSELVATNKELETFAYAVSHDLRAPLRAMKGFSQALLEDYGDRFEGEAKTYLDQIGIATHKMGELIEAILALTRSARGELQRDTVNMSALATGILADLARTDPVRAVTTEIEPGLEIDGDTRMIESVMRNLLGNAWKYTGKTPAPMIRVYSGEVAGLSGICVADNGAGFDMAHADHLFQPFRRLHRQDEFPGIGIGLATAQRIVNRHGGQIRAHAVPGEGATFCFTLTGESGAG